MSELGEAIVFLTKAAYMQYQITREVLAEEELVVEDERDDSAMDVDHISVDREALITGDDEVEGDDDLAPQPVREKTEKEKAMSPIAIRDRKFLADFLVTEGCRRIPWDTFFANSSKDKSKSLTYYFVQVAIL